MMDFAKTLEFEKAQEIKEKIQLLDTYTAKTSIVGNTTLNAEVFAYEEIEGGIILNAMKVVNGCLISSLSQEVKSHLEEEKKEIFTTAITQLREQMEWKSDLIIVSEQLSLPEAYAKQDLGENAEKKKLLDLCQ
jgi:excinuclease ABC subunit C